MVISITAIHHICNINSMSAFVITCRIHFSHHSVWLFIDWRFFQQTFGLQSNHIPFSHQEYLVKIVWLVAEILRYSNYCQQNVQSTGNGELLQKGMMPIPSQQRQNMWSLKCFCSLVWGRASAWKHHTNIPFKLSRGTSQPRFTWKNSH